MICELYNYEELMFGELNDLVNCEIMLNELDDFVK